MGSTKTKSFDIILHKAMRFFLGVQKYAPNAAVLGDMGWLKAQFTKQLCAICMWNRLIRPNNERLTKIAFEWDYAICENNWCSDI